MRGQLTSSLKSWILETLGKEFDTTELRLVPYVHYCLTNSQGIDPRKLNSADRQILSDWRARGWIVGGMSGLGCSKEFWDAMSEILYRAYVLCEDEEEN